MLCLRTLLEAPQAIQTIFAMSESLASGSLLELELSTFIVSSLTATEDRDMPRAMGMAQTIRVILNRGSEMNEFLCSQVLDLIG